MEIAALMMSGSLAGLKPRGSRTQKASVAGARQDQARTKSLHHAVMVRYGYEAVGGPKRFHPKARLGRLCGPVLRVVFGTENT